MIVPDHWAEARRRHRVGGRQVTVRRFGWSDASVADAQAMADARAEDALRRILAGDALERRERKAAYNGAAGVPIREEVLSRHGPEVVTRNSYGAHCLNTPRALFADIDFAARPASRDVMAAFLVLALVAAGVGLWTHRLALALLFLAVAGMLCVPLALLVQRIVVSVQGGPAGLARRRLEAFLAARPAWSVRVYETPAGWRLLATHRAFDALEDEAQAFLWAVGADPLYVRMCMNQRCFRARLTAKPWRIGVEGHMRPRPGLWPVDPARRPVRDGWVARYEQVAAGFAACRFLEVLGAGVPDPALQPVVALHDTLSRATPATLPIA